MFSVQTVRLNLVSLQIENLSNALDRFFCFCKQTDSKVANICELAGMPLSAAHGASNNTIYPRNLRSKGE